MQRTFLNLILFCIIPGCLTAQKARYTELYKMYDVVIAGYGKNILHAWSANAEQSRYQSTNTTLTLQVFTPGMSPLSENSVPLGKIRWWNIDFQYTDTCYYANINYLADGRRNRLLKVDQSGNITDVSGTTGIWKKNIYPEDKNRFYATTKTNNNLFVAVTERAAVTDSMEAGSFIHLPGEKIAGSEVLEKLIVRKIDMSTRDWIFQVFGSQSSKFYYPLINVSDTAVTVTAMAEQSSPGVKDKNNRGPFLFLARLDTGLTDAGTKFTVLKTAHGNSDETYLPFQLSSIKTNSLLLYKGMFMKETSYFLPGSQSNGQLQIPRVVRSLVSNSLKITLINNQNHLLLDTIISKKYGTMDWDNFLIATTDTTADIFCVRNYSGSKNGITHFNINAAGIVREEDMIVNVQYEYKLNRAQRIAPGLLLVPFTRRNKTGLMRLEYSIIE